MLPGEDVLAPVMMLAPAAVGVSELVELLPSSRVPWDPEGRAGGPGWEGWLRGGSSPHQCQCVCKVPQQQCDTWLRDTRRPLHG